MPWRVKGPMALLVGLLCFTAACGPVFAQMPALPPPTDPMGAARDATAGVQEAKPPVFYLKDKEGQYVPVVGFTLEDFERLMDQDATRSVKQQRPGYRLEKIVATGTAGTDQAELTVDFTIFIDQQQWVPVPLRLGGAAVRGRAKYTGPGEYRLQYDQDAGEYVAWLQGEAEKPHQLSLHVVVPLDDLSGRRRLRLSTPRAWTSELNLKVPLARAVAQVTPGAIVEETSQLPPDETEFKVLGLGGDFAISWWQSSDAIVQTRTVLESTGALVARIDGGSVHTEAELTVRSLGQEFESFRVQLPPGATLLSGDQSEYSLEVINDERPDRPGSGGQQIEVRLQQPTVGPVTVRLVTERTRDAARLQEWLELGGFRVLGAVRQWGHLAVQLDGNWQVLWGDRRQVRQVENLPDTLLTGNVVAGFEFFAQPFSLPARVLPRETRVSIDPEYLVLVGAERMELEARLKYRVGGAKAFALDIDFAGWQVDEVGPTNLVDVDKVVIGSVAPLSLPLILPSTGEFELFVRAHRDVAAEEEKVQFALPRPQANLVGSAALVVLPADNIELVPREADLLGLVRQRAGTNMQLPARQQQPWTYRSEATEARFAADRRIHSQAITLNMSSMVTLGETDGLVQQRLAYNVAREPVEMLHLDVPYEPVESGKLEVNLGAGGSLGWVVVGDPPADTTQRVTVRVALPDKPIGAFELLVQYPLLHEKPIPQASVSLKVPLAMAGEGELSDNELTVVAAPGIRVQHLDGLWDVAEELIPSGSQGHQVRLSASAPRPEVVLGVRMEDRRAPDETVVDRAWIQTWLTQQARQDRVVYQLTTRRRQLRLTLPAGVLSADDQLSVYVGLNGGRVEVGQGQTASELLIPLVDHDGSARRYLLEVRYRFAAGTRQLLEDSLALAPPVLGKDVWVRRMYWQLVLPGDQHLVGSTKDFLPEHGWVWKNFYWGRQPLLNQAQLEEWSGSSHEAAPPPGTNQYLFSSLGSVGPLKARTMSRTRLVLFVAGAVLLLGLVLIHLPAARHPSVLLVAAICILASAAAYPEPALAAAQVAGVGLALALVAGVLKRREMRRSDRSVMIRSRPSSIVQRGPSNGPYAAVGGGSVSSTATVASPMSGPESLS